MHDTLAQFRTCVDEYPKAVPTKAIFDAILAVISFISNRQTLNYWRFELRFHRSNLTAIKSNGSRVSCVLEHCFSAFQCSRVLGTLTINEKKEKKNDWDDCCIMVKVFFTRVSETTGRMMLAITFLFVWG